MENNIEIKFSAIQGKGVFVVRDFQKGKEVFRYKRGRFVSREEARKLPTSDKNYLDVVDENTYEVMAEPGRYVNHSCDPSTIEKVGKREIVSYALHPIKRGEEITVDYRVRALDNWKLKCRCGAALCPGTVIGNFFSMPAKLQKKYLPYAPEFIQKMFIRKHG